MAFVEKDETREQVEGFVALYEGSSWVDFLAALKPLIDQFVARFQEIADIGPAENQDILLSMFTHEQSFMHWIDKELANCEARKSDLDEHNSLAIPTHQSDESEPGLNSQSPLTERGSDV
jgi:hypothetical protein